MMFTSKDLSQGHGGLRVDFPGGWTGDAKNLFTAEGRTGLERSSSTTRSGSSSGAGANP